MANFTNKDPGATPQNAVGTFANIETGAHEVRPYRAKVAMGIGVVVSRDATGELVLGGANLTGITCDPTYFNGQDNNDTFAVGDQVPVCRKGAPIVIAPANVNPTTPVRYLIATGELTDTTGSLTATIAGASYEEVATAGSEVPLRLNS